MMLWFLIVLFMEQLYAHFIDKVGSCSRNWVWILKTLKYFKILKITVDGLNDNLNLGYIYLKAIDLKANF